jgi:hypothetical protein
MLLPQQKQLGIETLHQRLHVSPGLGGNGDQVGAIARRLGNQQISVKPG